MPFLFKSTPTENAAKLLCQKPMLRQIEWGVQNEPITKNGYLALTTFFVVVVENLNLV